MVTYFFSDFNLDLCSFHHLVAQTSHAQIPDIEPLECDSREERCEDRGTGRGPVAVVRSKESD
jgi:hypothetical protein